MLGDKLKNALVPSQDVATTKSLHSTLTSFKKTRFRTVHLNKRGLKEDRLTEYNYKPTIPARPKKVDLKIETETHTP